MDSARDAAKHREHERLVRDDFGRGEGDEALLPRCQSRRKDDAKDIDEICFWSATTFGRKSSSTLHIRNLSRAADLQSTRPARQLKGSKSETPSVSTNMTEVSVSGVASAFLRPARRFRVTEFESRLGSSCTTSVELELLRSRLSKVDVVIFFHSAAVFCAGVRCGF